MFAFFRFFYDFLKIWQESTKVFYYWSFPFATRSLDLSKPHRYAPRLHKTPWKDLGSRNVILGHGGRGSGQFRRTGGAPDRGGVQGGVHAHPRPICARCWSGGATGGGARRWQAVAAAAVASAPARGAHGLGNKRTLELTCKVGKELGVLAGDERLGNGRLF
jgi:hypothetical protein